MALKTRKSSKPTNESESENPSDFAEIIQQQLKSLLPEIVTQVGDHVINNGGSVNGNGGGKGKVVVTEVVVVVVAREKMDSVMDISECADDQKMKYAASSLINKALTWWNTQKQARGRDAAIAMSWKDFKVLIMEKFCPDNEMQKLETQF
ncbi:gag-pol polyprotein [Artemisia annua]|uniref:Gag-pol polyprotein n=1 Tax=Artemisia annua TaxID=35608 RepID=A0A2U1N6V2_ARTAN|nr:gag-pol polyprotein [Artemisia annua]